MLDMTNCTENCKPSDKPKGFIAFVGYGSEIPVPGKPYTFDVVEEYMKGYWTVMKGKKIHKVISAIQAAPNIYSVVADDGCFYCVEASTNRGRNLYTIGWSNEIPSVGRDFKYKSLKTDGTAETHIIRDVEEVQLLASNIYYVGKGYRKYWIAV